MLESNKAINWKKFVDEIPSLPDSQLDRSLVAVQEKIYNAMASREKLLVMVAAIALADNLPENALLNVSVHDRLALIQKRMQRHIPVFNALVTESRRRAEVKREAQNKARAERLAEKRASQDQKQGRMKMDGDPDGVED